MGAEGTGDLHLINRLQAETLHHEFASGIKGPLRELYLTDVFLGDYHILSNAGLIAEWSSDVLTVRHKSDALLSEPSLKDDGATPAEVDEDIEITKGYGTEVIRKAGWPWFGLEKFSTRWKAWPNRWPERLFGWLDINWGLAQDSSAGEGVNEG